MLGYGQQTRWYQIVENLMLSSYKKSNLLFMLFLKYCYDIANLLFWVLQACLNNPSENNNINLKETFIFI